MIDKKPEYVARKKFNVFGQKLFCDWLQNQMYFGSSLAPYMAVI